MNDHDQLQEKRRQTFLQRAERKESEAAAEYQRSNELVDGIPMGQPILVGHHSERGHRRTLERSHAAMNRSVRLINEAKRLRMRAESVGKGGISSDDPEAIERLRTRLAVLIENQEAMKTINRQYKKGGWDAVTDVNEQLLEHLKTELSQSIQDRPFPSYFLSNNNQNIRRIRRRIEELEDAESFEDYHYVFEGFCSYSSIEDKRVRIEFDDKPPPKIIQLMRRNGFKFSHQHKAWQRFLNNNGLAAAKRVCNHLQLLNISKTTRAD